MNNKIICFYLSFFISFSSILAQEGIVLDPKMEPNQQRSEEIFLDSNSFFNSSFFGSIGYVNVGCIGTVVAPRVVLTVANCVVDGSGTKLSSLNHVWVKGQDIGIEKIFVKKGFNKNLNDNWAFILLDDNNFTNNNLNPMVAASIDFNDPNHQFPDYVQALGFDFRSRVFSYQKFCSLYKNQKNMLQTSCLSQTGINGSPLLISDERGRNATIVAMLSYHYVDARSKIQYVVGLDKDFFSNFEKIYEDSTDEESPFIRIDLKPKPQDYSSSSVPGKKHSILERNDNENQVTEANVEGQNQNNNNNGNNEDILSGVLDNNEDNVGSSNNAPVNDQTLVELVPPGTVVNEGTVNEGTDDLIDLPDAYPEDVVEDGVIVADDVVPDGAKPLEPPAWSDPEKTVTDDKKTVGTLPVENFSLEEEVIIPNEEGNGNTVPLTPPEWVDPNETTNTEVIPPSSNGKILPGIPLRKGQKPLDLPPPPQQVQPQQQYNNNIPSSNSNPLEGVITEEYTTPTPAPIPTPAPVPTPAPTLAPPTAPSSAAIPSDPFYYQYNQDTPASSIPQPSLGYYQEAIPLTVPNAGRINAIYGLPTNIVDPSKVRPISTDELTRVTNMDIRIKWYWLDYLNKTINENTRIIKHTEKLLRYMQPPYDGNLTQQAVMRNVDLQLAELRRLLQTPNHLKDMVKYVGQLKVAAERSRMVFEMVKFTSALDQTHIKFNEMARMIMATGPNASFTYVDFLRKMLDFRVNLQVSLVNLRGMYDKILFETETHGREESVRSSIALACIISYLDSLVRLSFN